MTPAPGIFAVLVGYLVGGIPVGLYVARARGIPDIRKLGSGNIGATNVLRVLGTKAGLAVWVIDCLKGAGPILLARLALGVEGWWLGGVGVAAALGHCYSPYLRFSGGRGVSTGLGMLMGLFWPVGLMGLAVFVLVVARTRYISVGSMTAAASSPLWVLVWGPYLGPYTAAYAVAAAVGALVIIMRHRPNIQRLRAGTEHKIGSHKGGDGGEDGQRG